MDEFRRRTGNALPSPRRCAQTMRNKQGSVVSMRDHIAWSGAGLCVTTHTERGYCADRTSAR